MKLLHSDESHNTHVLQVLSSAAARGHTVLKSTVENGWGNSLISLQELLCLRELLEACPVLIARGCCVLPHELASGVFQRQILDSTRQPASHLAGSRVHLTQPDDRSSDLVRLGGMLSHPIATLLLESKSLLFCVQATPPGQQRALAGGVARQLHEGQRSLLPWKQKPDGCC